MRLYPVARKSIIHRDIEKNPSCGHMLHTMVHSCIVLRDASLVRCPDVEFSLYEPPGVQIERESVEYGLGAARRSIMWDCADRKHMSAEAGMEAKRGKRRPRTASGICSCGFERFFIRNSTNTQPQLQEVHQCRLPHYILIRGPRERNRYIPPGHEPPVYSIVLGERQICSHITLDSTPSIFPTYIPIRWR